MRLKEAVEKYILYCQDLTPKTIKDKQRELGWFCDCVDKDVGQITMEDIQKFVFDLKKSDIRKWRVKVNLRAFFKWLNENNLSSLAYTLIKNKEPVLKRRPNVTEEDFKLMDETCHYLIKIGYKGRISVRWHAWLHFIYETGLRKSEALGLKLQDINFDDRSFSVKCAKSNRIRNGYFQTDMSNYLKIYPISKRRTRLFPISPREAGHIITELRDRAGILKPITCHSFRHGYVTRLLENGCSIQDTAILAGHVKIDTTMHYFHNVDLKNKYDQYFNKPKIYKFDSLAGIKQNYKIELKITKRK